MLINCKECGAEISDLAKRCPKCGCPTTNKSKLSVASFVLGIVSISYSFALLINNLFTENKNGTVLPSIIIMGILAIVFGMISVCKTKIKGKSLFGIILGVSAIVISVIAYLFF